MGWLGRAVFRVTVVGFCLGITDCVAEGANPVLEGTRSAINKLVEKSEKRQRDLTVQAQKGTGPVGRRTSRRFLFHYGGGLSQLPAGSKVQVWLPVPPENAYQSVERIRQRLPVVRPKLSREPKYGNQIMYFEVPSPKTGRLEWEVSYQVKRHEVLSPFSTGPRREYSHLSAEERALFLSANSLVPIKGKPVLLLRGLPKMGDSVEERIRAVYNTVNKHMHYESQLGSGRGDALWACESRSGNCTDFHSLFISLARSQGVPSRFEMGFSIPTSIGSGVVEGYHCWAFFYAGGYGWIPVDISEANRHPELEDYYFGNLTANRVAFSTGRDIRLVPSQAGKPLNYFIYPHVQVEGVPWPEKKIEKRFSFIDL